MHADPTKYPKCKYHAGENPVLVNDPEEERKLGSGWVDHPNLAVDGLPSAADLDVVAGEQEIANRTKRPYVRRTQTETTQ